MVNYKIAISGKARAGKNTVAEMLTQSLEYPFSKIVALADPMKHIVKTMFPEAKNECLYGPSELRSEIIDPKYLNIDGLPLTYRQALIDLGAHGRRYNSNIWLNVLVQDANRSQDINTYIVSDVRFINEFKYLKESGFSMIRILRRDSTHINDISEIEQESIKDSEFDYVIYNDGTFDELRQQVRNIAHKLVGIM
jgi:hypothetical protein